MQASMDHVANAVQNTQHQLATQLQQMQSMMQSMKMKLMQFPMAHVNTMRSANIMKEVDTTVTNPITAAEEGAEHKTTEIGVEAVVVKPTVISHITVGNTECVPIQVNTTGTQQMATKRTRYGVTRCRAVRETAPSRSGQYLIIKLMWAELKI